VTKQNLVRRFGPRQTVRLRITVRESAECGIDTTREIDINSSGMTPHGK
jgi:hypothetical protein